MPVDPNTVKVGDYLYDCHMQRCGNTEVSAMACWGVRILAIEPKTEACPYRSFTVSWNGNKPQRYTDSQIHRLRKAPATVKVYGNHVCRVEGCGATEDLRKCCGCGRRSCKKHGKEDPCRRGIIK